MTWTLPQFHAGRIRKRPGRPSQDSYRQWTEHELMQLRTFKEMKIKYRVAADVLGRSYQSVKAMGAKL